MTKVGDISVLGLEYLILFKMKAYLDLSGRKETGEHIDSKNIKKHKNDVIRLGANLEPDNDVRIIGQVRKDALAFLEKLKTDPVNPRSLGINADEETIIARIRNCFHL